MKRLLRGLIAAIPLMGVGVVFMFGIEAVAWFIAFIFAVVIWHVQGN